MASGSPYSFENTPGDRDPYQSPAGPPPGPKGEGLGCFFWGCVTLLVLIILGSIGLFYLTRFGIRSAIEPMTTAQPVELPDVEYEPEEAEEVRARVQSFRETLDRDEPAELELSDRDLNILLHENAETQQFADYVYVDIEEDEISGEISFPLQTIGENIPLLRFLLGRQFMEERYFHGEIDFTLSIDEGRPDIDLISIASEGKEIPENIQEQIRRDFERQNIEAELLQDPETREALRTIETLRIADDRLYLSAVPRDESTTETQPVGDVELIEDTGTTAGAAGAADTIGPAPATGDGNSTGAALNEAVEEAVERVEENGAEDEVPTGAAAEPPATGEDVKEPFEPALPRAAGENI